MLKNITNPPVWATLSGGGIIGAIIFIALYGTLILNPYYDAWLLVGGDLSQHYLGWLFYKDSEWHFPIGLIDNLIYPNQIAVVYTDSIPWFAIIFKVLSPLFKGPFQYFGIYGLFCFIMQGIFATLIIRKFTKNIVICLIASILFIIYPPVLQRMYVHTALASHWIILASFTTVLYNDSLKTYKHKILLWSILAVFASLTHPYFIPMIFVTLFFLCLYSYVTDRGLLANFLLMTIPALAGLSSLFIIGAFYDIGSTAGYGLGFYSFNLNGFFNPMGDFSIFLQSLATATDKQYEGFAYIGLGGICLLIMGITLTLAFVSWNIEPIKTFVSNNLQKIFIFMAFIVFVFLATGGNITFGEHGFAYVGMKRILSTFRASGRFIWPAMYIILIFSLSMIIKRFKTEVCVPVLALIVLLQTSDLSQALEKLNQKFRNKQEYYQTGFDLNKIIKSNNYLHIILLNPFMGNMYSLAYLASQNNVTLNDFYLARPNKKHKELVEENTNKFYDNNMDNNTLYIMARLPIKPVKANIYKLDNNMFIASAKPISGLKNEYVTKNQDILPKNNQYLEKGIDTTEGRNLYPSGTSYGPYTTMLKGNYLFTVKGFLDGASMGTWSNLAGKHLDLKLIEKSNDSVTYLLNNDKFISDFEFRIFNNGDKNIIIKNIIMEPMEGTNNK